MNAYAGFGDIPTVSTVLYRPLGVDIPTEVKVKNADGTVTTTQETTTIPAPILYVGGAVVLGLVAWGIYSQYQISKAVAEKEGSSGLLKLYAGEAAIGVGSAAARRLMEKNKRKHKRNGKKAWTLKVHGRKSAHISAAADARRKFRNAVFEQVVVLGGRREVSLFEPSGRLSAKFDGFETVTDARGAHDADRYARR